jgi:hypothetical protein
MLTGSFDLHIRSGDSWSQIFTIAAPDPTDPTGHTPGTLIDLTGCTAEMQIVAMYSVAEPYLLTSESVTANGGTLVLGGTAGTVSISIPPVDSLLLANGQYELRIKYADSSIQTLLSGSVFVEREIATWH